MDGGPDDSRYFKYVCMHKHKVYLYCRNCDLKAYELVGHYANSDGIEKDYSLGAFGDDHTFVCRDCNCRIYARGLMVDEDGTSKFLEGGLETWEDFWCELLNANWGYTSDGLESNVARGRAALSLYWDPWCHGDCDTGKEPGYARYYGDGKFGEGS